jgi:hypothetical protein
MHVYKFETRRDNEFKHLNVPQPHFIQHVLAQHEPTLFAQVLITTKPISEVHFQFRLIPTSKQPVLWTSNVNLTPSRAHHWEKLAIVTAFPLATDKRVSDRPMLPVEKLPVLPEKICVGSVVWLRQRFYKDEDITCVRRRHCRNFKLEKEGYRHPLVILKV